MLTRGLCLTNRDTRQTSGNGSIAVLDTEFRLVERRRALCAACAVLIATCLVLAGCDEARPKQEATGPGQSATDTTPVVMPCEPPRFTPIGTPLSLAATDTKTGQQCRSAENAPRFFQSLPLCRELVAKEKAGPSCGERFTPLGTPLARVALDTTTGQECRTAENAPDFFQSLPMCRDLH